MRVFRVVLLCLGAVVSLPATGAVAAPTTTTQAATTQTTVTLTTTTAVPQKPAVPREPIERPSFCHVLLAAFVLFAGAVVGYVAAALLDGKSRSAIYIAKASYLALRASVAIFLLYAVAIAAAYVIAVGR